MNDGKQKETIICNSGPLIALVSIDSGKAGGKPPKLGQ